MKRIVKIFCLFLFSLIIVGLNKSAQANSISKISMDIYIQDNGDAIVTEEWNCNTSEGTEVYHPYYNLGNSEIKDLKVKEDENTYQTLSTWKTSGTLSEKANKCGINQIKNGIELCWGMGTYGTHTYTVQYTITKFVAELTDSQMIYWTLIPYDFSNSIGNVYIKIHTNFDIPDDIDVWGYGNYGGTAYVYDGYIEMQSDGILSTDEYMTILVKFPIGTFNTTNVLNNDFSYYYEMAEEGAKHYVNNDESDGAMLVIVVFTLVNVILWILLLCEIKNNGKPKLKYGEYGKNIPRNVSYYRDIPCKKDIFRAYYIGYNYNLLKNKTDILGAIILKWLKEGKIRIEQKEKSVIFKKEDAVIIMNETNPEEITNDEEKKIFKMLYEASKDGILESKEFERWCQKKYSTILKWFDNLLEKEESKLINEGIIEVKEKKVLKTFKRKENVATYELKQEALELAGLKRYLKEYTLIKDRDSVEVILFEEYLMFAQVMGIAKQVAKEFKNLYPEIIEESNFNSYDHIVFINTCTSRGITSARTAKARAESYSSGGGGFSSGGGGGGSFGGGGGGRRLPLIRKKIKKSKVLLLIKDFALFRNLTNKTKIKISDEFKKFYKW